MSEQDPAANDYLSVREAAERYGVPLRTMAKRASLGEIEGAVKVRGARGMEWRVPVAALEAYGYRQSEHQPSAPKDPMLEAMRRTAIAERNRADEADRRLGHALLECGRLRARLAEEEARRRYAEAQVLRLAKQLIGQAGRPDLERLVIDLVSTEAQALSNQDVAVEP